MYAFTSYWFCFSDWGLSDKMYMLYVLIMVLWNNFLYYPHFGDEEMELVVKNLPRSHGKQVI